MAVAFTFICLSLFFFFSATAVPPCERPSFSRNRVGLHSSFLRTPSLSAASSSSSSLVANGVYKTKYFTQALDHFNFNPQSYQVFQQRYLMSDRYWGGASLNAPIFVYMGNEADVEWYAQNIGFLFDNAPYFKALVIFIEHRFYGESIPFGGNKSVAYSNASTLGYLSSTQALADYATLILDLKNNLTALHSPVVVFGGSYGGMLAAWFRLKYPHIAIGALASSAPLLSFDNSTSPYGIYDIITQDFKSASENCYEVIKESWMLIEDAAKRPGGYDHLGKSFKLCKKMTNANDIFSLQSWLATAYSTAALSDYPTASNLRIPLPAFPVEQMCRAIDGLATENNTFVRLHAAMNVFYNYTGGAECFDLDRRSNLRDIGSWPWNWQSCTEMIIPMAQSKQSMFPPSDWDYSYEATNCRMQFGIIPRPHWITTEFGAQYEEGPEAVRKQYHTL